MRFAKLFVAAALSSTLMAGAALAQSPATGGTPDAKGGAMSRNQPSSTDSGTAAASRPMSAPSTMARPMHHKRHVRHHHRRVRHSHM